MDDSKVLFSSDFDALHVGATFITDAREISEADVEVFAGLTGDHHPQHTDADWAEASHFGERIAHGMLVVSCAVGLVPLDPERIVALRRIEGAVFKRPVKLGDSIHVNGRIAGVKPIDTAAGLVSCEWFVRNQDDHLVTKITVDVIWRRGPISAPAAPAATERIPAVV